MKTKLIRIENKIYPYEYDGDCKAHEKYRFIKFGGMDFS